MFWKRETHTVTIAGGSAKTTHELVEASIQVAQAMGMTLVSKVRQDASTSANIIYKVTFTATKRQWVTFREAVNSALTDAIERANTRSQP